MTTRDILIQLAKGQTAKQIAYKTNRNRNGVEAEIERLKRSFKAINTPHLIAIAYEMQILKPNTITTDLKKRDIIKKLSKSSRIIQKACEYFNTCPMSVMGRSRQRQIVMARHVSMYLLKETGLTLAAIGEMYKKDHTTVIHAIKAVNDQLEVNEVFRNQFEEIQQIIYN
jgi:chromosomal replication initiation ATPase DnaA